MAFEGTGKYFLFLFLIFFIVFITVKCSIAHVFKSAKIPAWKAFIPFYNKLVLIDLLDIKRSTFLKTFIPFVNLYYYYIIISKLLEAYQLNPGEAIWFLIIPMYKFSELAFKDPEFRLHLYDNTEEFIHNEKSLFEKEQPKVEEINNVNMTGGGTIINPAMYNQTGDNNVSPYNETVFSNSSLQPDERKETIIEAKEEVQKSEGSPIYVNNLKPKVCPKCGTKLEPTAKTCFFCGTSV